jgi:hypothetical protein
MLIFPDYVATLPLYAAEVLPRLRAHFPAHVPAAAPEAANAA